MVSNITGFMVGLLVYIGSIYRQCDNSLLLYTFYRLMSQFAKKKL